jgi:acyl-CoA synthetase (NDP forming)
MRTITLIDFQRNPDLQREFDAAARRERARQIVLLVKSLFSKGPRRAARSHLAAQG